MEGACGDGEDGCGGKWGVMRAMVVKSWEATGAGGEEENFGLDGWAE